MHNDDLLFHLFADDNQLYLSFIPGSKIDTHNSLTTSQKCVQNINDWMLERLLKNNGDKMEAAIFGTRQ